MDASGRAAEDTQAGSVRADGPPQASAEAGRKAGGKALLAILAFVAALALLRWAFPAAALLWLKAFHVIGVIAWMAGLLYLPRLFVYHTDAPHGTAQSATFTVMETRLMKVIMTPAMIFTWVVGLWLSVASGWLAAGWEGWWLWVKIACVIGLTAAHLHFAGAIKRFDAADGDRRTARHWRMVNEVPTLLMVAIVVLVIVFKDL